MFVDNYMDNSSGSLASHDSWSALQIPNSSGMGPLAHTTNTTSNTRSVLPTSKQRSLEGFTVDLLANRAFSALQPVPELVVRCGNDPHPIGLSIGVHHGRPDVSVPTWFLGVLLGADLLSARVLSLLHV